MLLFLSVVSFCLLLRTLDFKGDKTDFKFPILYDKCHFICSGEDEGFSEHIWPLIGRLASVSFAVFGKRPQIIKTASRLGSIDFSAFTPFFKSRGDVMLHP